MSLVELASAGIVIFLAGYWVGCWQMRRLYKRYGPRQDRHYVEIEPGQLVILSEFGKLPMARARALAALIAHGCRIRSRTLVGKGKLLRRSEWDALIAGEWRDRGWTVKGTDGIYTPSPTCIAFCEKIAPRRTRAPAHQILHN